VKGIQVCSNKGPRPLQRGYNYKYVKMGWGHLKIFFSRIASPEKLKSTYYKIKFVKIIAAGGRVGPQ
jgi:hypothetical protein